jgi:NAD(P)-dependent dehydrogenase (short-subunit alcohol dehydrogenase family)
VVVVVGNNGRQPNAAMLPGSAANAACLAVIKGLADTVARDGVTINALNPGPTRTGRWSRLIEGLARQTNRPPAEIEAEQLARMPMGRIGEPIAMGRLAVILASDLADMVTGASLTADGGATKSLP